MLTRCACLQEDQDIIDLLQENREEMDLLAKLYNEEKERLDQTRVMQDLQWLRTCARLHRIYFALRIQAHRYSVVRSANILNGLSRPMEES